MTGGSASPPCSTSPFDRDTFENSTVAWFRKDLHTGPDVRLVQVGDLRCVVKDWKPRSSARRFLLGRFLLRREHRLPDPAGRAGGDPTLPGLPPTRTASPSSTSPGAPSPRSTRTSCPTSSTASTPWCATSTSGGSPTATWTRRTTSWCGRTGNPAIIDFGGSLRRSALPASGLYFDLLSRHDRLCVERQRLRFEQPPPPPGAPPLPVLAPWQKRLLVFFHKMERD